MIAETWMQDQIMAYYRGKKKLAEMMGRDPATFSEEDVDVRKLQIHSYSSSQIVCVCHSEQQIELCI